MNIKENDIFITCTIFKKEVHACKLKEIKIYITCILFNIEVHV